MPRERLIRLFEANDGRRVSLHPLYVRKGERANLISSGWGCEDGEILAYKFLHYQKDKCDDQSLIHLWTKQVDCGDLQSVEVPVIKLTKANAHDIISEHGQYLLVRQRGAEEVALYAKYDSRP